MDILKEFPDDIIVIDISYRNIQGTLYLTRFTNLKKLNCYDNQITSLNNLPSSLIELYCNCNKIKILDFLPSSLIELDCCNNQITSLDCLPSSLVKLY